MVQVTVYSGAQRRREWSDDEKLTILGAAFASGACVTEVARRLDIAPSLIYRWRSKFAARGGAGFAPVLITPEPAPASSTSAGPPPLAPPDSAREAVGCAVHVAMIVTARGVRIEVMHDAAPELITTALGALVV